MKNYVKFILKKRSKCFGFCWAFFKDIITFVISSNQILYDTMCVQHVIQKVLQSLQKKVYHFL